MSQGATQAQLVPGFHLAAAVHLPLDHDGIVIPADSGFHRSAALHGLLELFPSMWRVFRLPESSTRVNVEACASIRIRLGARFESTMVSRMRPWPCH